MSNFINATNEGTQITGEKIYVSGLNEVVLEHDNWFDLTLYYDAELANVVPSGLYTQDEYDAEYAGYNKLELNSAVYDSYDFVYATYKTKGDYVDADDMNNKQDMIIKKECGENIIAYRAVMLKNGKLWYPNLLVTSDVWKTEGISIQSGNTGQKIEVQQSGILKNDVWAWDVTKDIFIASSGGVLTQTAPPEGIIKIIATPLDPNTIKIINLTEISRS